MKLSIYHEINIVINLLFFVFIAKATSECDCPDVNRPVCGTDNISYRNLCILQCEQVKKPELLFFYNGTCCPHIECPLTENSLCDNYGKTHINECKFRAFKCVFERTMGLKLEKVYDGTCKAQNCPKKCSDDYDPVCDTEKTIYKNVCVYEKIRCELEKENIKIHLAKDPKFCLNRSQKVFGVETYSGYLEGENPIDGYDNPTPVNEADLPNSHQNHIEASHAVLDTIHNNATSTTKRLQTASFQQPCNIAECDKNWDPVCDTKNRTHKNICHFMYYACKVNQIDGTLLDIAHLGSCQLHGATCISCPKDEKPIPVCDNKNMTHPNLCSFIQFNCNLKKGEEERVLVHVKPCHSRSPQFELKDEICPSSCSRDVKPVCDEANNTHQNLCHFQQYNCNMRKIGVKSPYLRYLRPCIKNRKVDTAVENVELQATVTQVQMKPVESEKTTFIFSTPEHFKETSQSSIPTQRIPEPTETTLVPTTSTRTTTLPTTTTTINSLFDCPKPNCPTEGQPVCDSAGNLHGNLCEFTYSRCLAASKGEQLQIAEEANCISEKACQMPCTDESHPICASDFSTYKNLCHFRKQKCLDPTLEVLFKGKCAECLDSPCAHPAFDAPDDAFVCVEDGSTKSLCEYQMLSCIFERGYGVNLTIQYIGKCCPRIETCDDEKPSPVCANNGVTFFTKCEFEIENCKNAKLEIPLLEVVSEGVCDRTLPDGFSKPFDDEVSSSQMEFKRDNRFNCSQECDKTYDPLCGTDGVTYSNACSLQLEICRVENSTLEVAYPGMCCDINCPNDFSPVCDSSGKTHQNICHFGVNRCIAERTSGEVLTIEKFDICNDVAECRATCPKEYLPVCATNGQNVINPCELNRINCLLRNNVTSGEILIKDYDGECCRETDCALTFSPVCDSNGITHANECIMRHQACIQKKKFNKEVTIAYQGQCCNQPCSDEFAPICDGTTTHSNMCKFKIAQCEANRLNKTLSVAYNGECCKIPTGDCETSGPVCDSDGQTHSNHCEYQQRKCISQQTLNRNLTIVHTGL
ncbi:unnamed protein product [Caenorhabditis bovis]|uniref:Kazal-like domain-containing protein n=1 Tax=Caenorhabditis bovis TaxID=2654633 RepID=A0A8S1ENU8_9PELO|nr:unnamed protein product [Caenorhabditis bovis]